MDNKMFDDMAKVAQSALGSAYEAKKQGDAWMASVTEQMMQRMQLVTREEYEAVKDMAAKARMQVEALEKRVAALEGKKKPAAKKPAAKKATAKKTAKKK